MCPPISSLKTPPHQQPKPAQKVAFRLLACTLVADITDPNGAQCAATSTLQCLTQELTLTCGLKASVVVYVVMRSWELERFVEELNLDEHGQSTKTRSDVLATYQETKADVLNCASACPKSLHRHCRCNNAVSQARERRQTYDTREEGSRECRGPQHSKRALSFLRPVPSRATFNVPGTATEEPDTPRILAMSGAGHEDGAATAADEVRSNAENTRGGAVDSGGVDTAVDRSTKLREKDHEGLFVQMSGDTGQVEARTPPAMERNLFLSALANGRLEVTMTAWRDPIAHPCAV